MSIEKVIHYCWFGRKPKNAKVENCIASWKRICPDYKIVEWNEDNFDVNMIPFTREAYKCGRWSFVSDYARLWIIYNYGGIYLDTDIEMVKATDRLLEEQCFFGFEITQNVKYRINTGGGFGAVKHHPAVKRIMDYYADHHFLGEDGTEELIVCSETNTAALRDFGLKTDGSMQRLGDILILPVEYFAPINYYTREKNITENTVWIHHYAASWMTKKEKVFAFLLKKLGRKKFMNLVKIKHLFWPSARQKRDH